MTQVYAITMMAVGGGAVTVCLILVIVKSVTHHKHIPATMSTPDHEKERVIAAEQEHEASSGSASVDAAAATRTSSSPSVPREEPSSPSSSVTHHEHISATMSTLDHEKERVIAAEQEHEALSGVASDDVPVTTTAADDPVAAIPSSPVIAEHPNVYALTAWGALGFNIENVTPPSIDWEALDLLFKQPFKDNYVLIYLPVDITIAQLLERAGYPEYNLRQLPFSDGNLLKLLETGYGKHTSLNQGRWKLITIHSMVDQADLSKVRELVKQKKVELPSVFDALALSVLGVHMGTETLVIPCHDCIQGLCVKDSPPLLVRITPSAQGNVPLIQTFKQQSSGQYQGKLAVIGSKLV